MKIEQARRVCYLLWLLAALLSAPTLVARVCVEVSKDKDKDEDKDKDKDKDKNDCHFRWERG